jgi:hypothetical protein
MEFHVHIDASLLFVGSLLAQNITRKSDQLVLYAYRLFNSVEHNYSTIEREALVTIFALHKFRHYMLRNKCVLC